MVLNETEMTVDLGREPLGVYDDTNEVYHPFYERHYASWSFVALRDIQAGEELLDNYLPYAGGQTEENWIHGVMELKHLCTGGVGHIAKYEEAK